MTDLQTISTDLLRLEKTFLSEGLSSEQQDQWTQIMEQWLELTRGADQRRRFLRFPMETSVKIRRKGMVHSLDMVEISNLGIQVKGNLEMFEDGDEVLWEAVDVDGRWTEIGATCKVMRKEEGARAGLELVGHDWEIGKRVRSVYYPAYIKVLEGLAAGNLAE